MRTPSRYRVAPALSGFLLLLAAACNSQPQNIEVGPPDDMKDKLATAKKVELPPAITAQKTYRCKDNSVVYVDFFNDSKTANVRTKAGTPAVHVVAPAAGQPMVAEGGYSVSGPTGGATVTIAVPGHPAQPCDA